MKRRAFFEDAIKLLEIQVPQRQLKAAGETQHEVDVRILAAIAKFVTELAG